jgi:D-inositol-3-phosphate glycosyltransferase
MDVAVLTSKNEGFPNVVMEAMASGTPVVAANVGGVPELIRSGETGILIDGRDPQAFADAIERCLDDPEASVAMADAALAHVREHLSVDSMVSNYRELYLRLLNEAATEGKD